MEKIRCPKCGKEARQNKHGKSKVRSQRYSRKHCNKTYVIKPKWRRYNEETKKQAIKLYMEVNSGRSVVRILGISINTCIYWIKKYANAIKEKRYPNERVEVIEMDELYSFIERKKQNLCNNSGK